MSGVYTRLKGCWQVHFHFGVLNLKKIVLCVGVFLTHLRASWVCLRYVKRPEEVIG